jgi:hypothetical protein
MSSYKAQVNALLRQRGQPAIAAPTFSAGGEESISFLKVGGSILIIVFVILIILLVVHYTIRPVFKTKSNGKGFIPVPGVGVADDGSVYWTTLPHGDLLEVNTIFGGPGSVNNNDPGQSSKLNYSLSVDLYFNDLNNGVNADGHNRKVFCRYNPLSQSTNNLDYSILMELAPDKNDLFVQLRTATNTQQATLRNILPKTPTRIGLIVGEKYFEVYRDGKLVSTQIIDSSPGTHIGKFWGDPGNEPPVLSISSQATSSSDTNLFVHNPPAAAQPACPAGSAGPLGVVYNLHLWRRVISPEEMRDAVPRLLSSDDYNKDVVSATSLQLYFKRLNQELNKYGDAVSATMDDWGGRIGAAANALSGTTS